MQRSILWIASLSSRAEDFLLGFWLLHMLHKDLQSSKGSVLL